MDLGRVQDLLYVVKWSLHLTNSISLFGITLTQWILSFFFLHYSSELVHITVTLIARLTGWNIKIGGFGADYGDAGFESRSERTSYADFMQGEDQLDNSVDEGHGNTRGVHDYDRSL